MNQKEITPQNDQGDFTPDKAYLLGFMAGDGHVSDRPEWRTYRIVLAPGPDERLAREVAEVVRKVYGDDLHIVVKPPAEKDCWEVQVSSILIVRDMESIAPFGIHRWRVPERILKGSKTTQGQWIAGFADADGCAQHQPITSRRYFSFSSVNKVGLRQVCTMLASMGIDHCLNPGNRTRTPETEHHSEEWKITVGHRPSLEKLVDLIPFRAPDKVATLAAALLSYKREWVLRTKDADKLVAEFEDRVLVRHQTYEQIAVEMGLRYEQVRGALRARKSPALLGRGSGERHMHHEKIKVELETLFREGHTLQHLADHFGLTKPQIEWGLKRLGLSYGRGRGRESDRSDQLRAALPLLKSLADTGLTNKEICVLPEVVKLDLIPTRLGNLFSSVGYKRPEGMAKKNIRRKQFEGELARDKGRTARKVAEWEALNAKNQNQPDPSGSDSKESA